MKIRVTFVLLLILLSQIIVFFYLQSKLNSAASSHLLTAFLNQSHPYSIATPRLRSDVLRDIRTVTNSRYIYQRGNFTILSNYIQGTLEVQEFGTITLVTQTTLDYMDNILTLVQYWGGPISLAVYAPGPEFVQALLKISFYQSCSSSADAIKSNVFFHIFFETKFLPTLKNGDNFFDMVLPSVNCDEFSPPIHTNTTQKPAELNFRQKKELFYPINVARNIGRELAKTHFVLVSDIEMLPNPPDLIPKFLDLIQRRVAEGKRLTRAVFVLPPFELSGNVALEDIPRSKSKLLSMMKKKHPLALPFHYYACFLCHRIPQYWDWTHPKSNIPPDSGSLNIFHSSPYVTTAAWEPFYIGSRFDPPFAEQLYRENALNKVIQAGILCHLNYTFHILDQAFLVHMPGIKYGKTYMKSKWKIDGIKLARNEILPLQFRLYGRMSNKCWQMDSITPM